jgi:hypothetical protein
MHSLFFSEHGKLPIDLVGFCFYLARNEGGHFVLALHGFFFQLCDVAQVAIIHKTI